MKVLVIGSLPPPERPRSRSLRAEVASILADGHTVEVIAPDPLSTAHRYLGVTGLPGCLQLWAIVAKFDSVLVQIQPGLPVRARAGGFERAVCLLAFSLVLGHGHHVVIRLESVDDLPGGLGGPARPVWRRAERIVLSEQAQRDAFVTAVGPLAERLSYEVSSKAPDLEDDWEWGDDSQASVEDVMALVRKRAARERQALASADVPHFSGWEQLAAPGIAMTESDAAALRPSETARKPTDLARKALAAADRRPSLWRFARAARLARRGVYAVLRPDRDTSAPVG